jgi:hypothetical protein
VKLSEILVTKDGEVENLKQELQKMKATYENDIKKLKKAGPSGTHLNTLGNEDKGSLANMYAT